MAFVKKEGKRRILNYHTKNFLVVTKFLAVVALSFTKSSPQISGSYKCVPVMGVNYFIIRPCGFCKHDVRRTTKPLSVDARVMAPFVFKI